MVIEIDKGYRSTLEDEFGYPKKNPIRYLDQFDNSTRAKLLKKAYNDHGEVGFFRLYNLKLEDLENNKLNEMNIEETIGSIKESASEVYSELGPGWQEVVYQKAMEVSLRHKGLMYETQRILPITFKDHVIGESIPDLVVWVNNSGAKTAIVIDLKADSGIKEEHGVQVERYIRELKKQVRKNEEVYPKGYLINFFKEATSKKLQDGFEELNGVQIMEVT